MAGITPKQLRTWAAELRSTVDQGEFAPDEEHSLLDQVIDDPAALEDLEEQCPILYNALIRLEEDYSKQVEASNHTECSLDAVDALVALAAGGRGARDEDDGDPDAGLGPERN